MSRSVRRSVNTKSATARTSPACRRLDARWRIGSVRGSGDGVPLYRWLSGGGNGRPKNRSRRAQYAKSISVPIERASSWPADGLIGTTL